MRINIKLMDKSFNVVLLYSEMGRLQQSRRKAKRRNRAFVRLDVYFNPSAKTPVDTQSQKPVWFPERTTPTRTVNDIRSAASAFKSSGEALSRLSALRSVKNELGSIRSSATHTHTDVSIWSDQ